METLIETIRIALLADATDEARHQAALACRTIFTALEAKKGAPLVVPQAEAPRAAAPSAAGPMTQAAPPQIRPEQIAQMITALRGVPPEQLLDMAIDRLRKALPAGVAIAPVPPLKFPMLPLGELAATVDSKGGAS